MNNKHVNCFSSAQGLYNYVTKRTAWFSPKTGPPGDKYSFNTDLFPLPILQGAWHHSQHSWAFTHYLSSVNHRHSGNSICTLCSASVLVVCQSENTGRLGTQPRNKRERACVNSRFRSCFAFRSQTIMSIQQRWSRQYVDGQRSNSHFSPGGKSGSHCDRTWYLSFVLRSPSRTPLLSITRSDCDISIRMFNWEHSNNVVMSHLKSAKVLFQGPWYCDENDIVMGAPKMDMDYFGCYILGPCSRGVTRLRKKNRSRREPGAQT